MTNQLTHFFSADVDEIEARMRAQYGKANLVDASTSMEESTFTASAFFLTRMVFAGAFAVDAELPFVTTVFSSGRYRWDIADNHGDARASPLLIRPGMPVHASCGEGKMIAVSFDGLSLERAARALYGDDRFTVAFDLPSAISTSHAQLYRSLLIHAAGAVPLLLQSDLLQASVYRMIVTSLLECFALRGEPTQRRDSVASRQAGYRRAHSYIDEHAAQAITPEDVASAASLSVAQLDDAVRSFSTGATTAAEELRRARFAGAHRDLLAADPTRGATVAAVALRWGFTPANFARGYRRAFGVTPMHTLSR